VTRVGIAPEPPEASGEACSPAREHEEAVSSAEDDRTEALPYQLILESAEREGRVLRREDIYGSGPPVEAVSEEVLAFVASHVGERVLDVGCGVGAYVDRLNELGKDSIGIDNDPAVVEIARARGRPVTKMSACDLEFEDRSFDSVVMIEVLEHIPEYERALREAVRVARRSVVVTVPDISVLPLMSKRLVVPWHLLEATHVNFFTPETLRKTLLRFASSCEVVPLGHFFDVEGEPLHIHAAAAAYL
jgi:2-polyprenyl-3-methyl-5-hydroxy-6-metoxy-1,4-benzoquinol methylase